MKNNIARSIIGYWPISNRVIMVKLQGKPFNINILQTYAPTQDHNDDDIEQFYEEIQQTINQAKSDEMMCMMGDRNAKAGSISHSNIVGNFGLGDKNDRGERLIQTKSIDNNKYLVSATTMKTLHMEKSR